MRHPLPPVYLIAGGRWKNFRRILVGIFQHAGLCRPQVAYLGPANGEDKDYFQMTAKALHAAGSGGVEHVRVCRKHWFKEAAACRIVLISGGDVLEGMRVLRKFAAIQSLLKLRRSGNVFVGISAGSIMLAKKWLDWPDEDDEHTVSEFPCLGIAPIYCDTHDEPRWEELRPLLERLPEGARGYGLRSGSAVAVGAGRVTVLAGSVDRFDRFGCGTKVKRTVLRSIGGGGKTAFAI